MTWNADNLPLINTVADQFVQIILDRLDDEHGVHVETAISAAGGVAGVAILRTAVAHGGIDLARLIDEKPGAYVVVEKVDEIGAQVSNFMRTICNTWGVNPQTGWNMTIPEKHKALRDLPQLVRDFEQPFNELMLRQSMHQEDYPFVAALASVKLIVMGGQAVDPDVGKAIALMAIVTASKTVPYN
jgi:hypothetical protein